MVRFFWIFDFLFVFQVCFRVFYSRFIIPSRYQLQDNNQQTIRVGRTVLQEPLKIKKNEKLENFAKKNNFKIKAKITVSVRKYNQKNMHETQTHTVTGSHTTAKIRGFYAGVIIKSLACAK